MATPTISVIVPVYNTAKYLHRCIDSILAQTFTDFEVLLIDDGSTDSSGEICDEYAHKDSRVQVFHKENGGVSSARILGLDNAQGEWVTFVDSDDYVYDDYLANFDIYNNRNFDLINQGLKIDKNFNGCSEFGLSFDGGINSWLNEATEKGIFGYVVIKLFKIEMIKKNNILFNAEFRFQEDEIFVLTYLSKCKLVKSVSKIGYFYFVPDWSKYIGGNIENKLKRSNLMIDILQKNFDKPEELLIYKKKKASLVHYYIEGNLRQFKYSYLKAIQNLSKEGYRISFIPKVLIKFISIDSIVIILSFLITTRRIYSKLTKRKIEYI